MEEIFDIEAFVKESKLVPTALLVQAGRGLAVGLELHPEGSPEAETINMLLLILACEYDQRQGEPLWRKAERFAVRNSQTFKEVGKIAACIGAGVVLGQSLDIKRP